MGESVKKDIDADPFKMAAKMSSESPRRTPQEQTPQEKAQAVFRGLEELSPVFDRIIKEHDREQHLKSSLGNVVGEAEGWRFDEGDEGGSFAVLSGDKPPLGPNDNEPARVPIAA